MLKYGLSRIVDVWREHMIKMLNKKEEETDTITQTISRHFDFLTLSLRVRKAKCRLQSIQTEK